MVLQGTIGNEGEQNENTSDLKCDSGLPWSEQKCNIGRFTSQLIFYV